MPDAYVTQTRNAVVASIVASGLSPGTAPLPPVVALYDVRFRLDDLRGGRVVVLPADKRVDAESRAPAQQHDVVVDVAVQYKFATPTPAEVDPYMDLAEGLLGFFDGLVLANGFTCVAGEFRHLFVQRHVEEFRTFSSVLSLTFRAVTAP